MSRPGPALAATTAAVLAGCYAPPPFQCDPATGACTPVDAAQAPPDADGKDGGGGGGCGGMSLVADEFGGATPGPVWGWVFNDQGTTLDVAGGELVLTPSQTGPRYAGVMTERHYDLRGDAVAMDIPQVVADAPGTEVLLRAMRGNWSDGSITMAYAEGRLRFIRVENGDDVLNMDVAYDPVAHRHWRLREDGGVVHFETSPDGQAWTSRATTAAPTWAAFAAVEISAGRWDNDTASVPVGAARIASVNGGTPRGSYCKASSLTDDFAIDGPAGLPWLRSFDDGTCAVRQAGGRAVIDAPAGSRRCALVSSAAYDLDRSAVSVQAVAVPAPAAAAAYLAAFEDDDSYVELVVQAGACLVNRNDDLVQTQLPCTTAYPAGTLYWRIASPAAGVVEYDVSPDGENWTQVLRDAESTVDLSAVDIELGFRAPPAGTDSGLRFDNYNLLPP